MIDQNEAKLKCLRWIEGMTMCSPEIFNQELGEYFIADDPGNDDFHQNDTGQNVLCRWACFSGDSFGFGQEFRGRGWAGLLKTMEEAEDPEGHNYVIEWEDRKGHSIEGLLETDAY